MKTTNQPLDKDALAQYDEQLAEYYLTRGSNNRRDTWSDHIRRTIIKRKPPIYSGLFAQTGLGDALKPPHRCMIRGLLTRS
ncbi:nitroreductase NfsA [Escherichia coli]|uniref:Nitroreductase NfsA n=1 Tax=Escherichia coli TaxID=562 RepID=A0A376MU90_ECOLX|nr:nitroreductase NfsA [Escherichia coli]